MYLSRIRFRTHNLYKSPLFCSQESGICLRRAIPTCPALWKIPQQECPLYILFFILIGAHALKHGVWQVSLVSAYKKSTPSTVIFCLTIKPESVSLCRIFLFCNLIVCINLTGNIRINEVIVAFACAPSRSFRRIP